MTDDLRSRLERLEHAHRRAKRQLASLATVTVLALAGLFVRVTTPPEIVRARGLVIEDAEGRDRILMGAPIPASAHRVRTNDSLVRTYWASTFADPEQYMGWYRNYRHSADGIVIMNEAGFDRVLLGDRLADSNLGRRMFEAAGITWNDARGFERGGGGVNTLEDGTSRAVFGLDDADGEAVHLIAAEDGTKALTIGGANGRLVIGISSAS
ncbi:MAG TPA: hypothetical protein PKE51_13955, partial [Gemmatimonadaceae bacterium]|nr:hypothetical protein [Gemmatimonadaceae bacterium]